MESKTLLLVDNEAASAIISKNVLMNYHYNVLMAQTGPQAINRVLNGEKIDLILMDVELDDDMDGVQAAQVILDSLDVPIIFLSSHTEPEYVERTLAIMHYGYVVKQTASTVLDTTIKNAFVQHSNHCFNKLFIQDRKGGFCLNKKFFQGLFDKRLGGYWEWDVCARQINLSPRLIRQLGYDEDQIGHESGNWNSLVLVDELECVDKLIRHHIGHETTRFQEITIRLRKKDNSVFQASGFCFIASRASMGEPDKVICGLVHGTALRERYELAHSVGQVVGNMMIPMIVISSRKTVLTMNDPFKELFGLDFDHMPQFTLDEYRDCTINSVEFVDMVDSVLEGNAGCYPVTFENPQRERIKVDIHFIPLFDENHVVDGAIAFRANPRKKPDGSIDSTGSLSELSDIRAFLSHGILYHDSAGRIIYTNPQASELIGALVDDNSTARGLFGLEWLRYDVDGSQTMAVEYPGFSALRTGRIINSARVGVHSSKMQKNIWLRIDALPLASKDGDGLPDRVVVILTDITDFREDEEKLLNRLEQKDMMIREIHHRIKNSLYALGGFIDIQASKTDDEYARTVLLTTNSHLNRLKSLYELVYQNDISGFVSGREYFSRLVDEIVRTFPLAIETDLRIQDVDLKVGVAENLGVIVNELITNAVKFAFSMDQENRFQLEMRFDDNRVHIVASDNGPGFDTESTRAGLGTELIMATIANRNGQYLTRNQNGAVSEIEFDLVR